MVGDILNLYGVSRKLSSCDVMLPRVKQIGTTISCDKHKQMYVPTYKQIG